MLIDILAKSRRATKCRRCGMSITYADTTGGKTIPFDGAIAAVPALSLFAGPDVLAVDTRRNPLHAAVCPANRKGRDHGPTRRR